MENEKKPDWKKEEEHLQECRKVIQSNLDSYEEQLKQTKAETKELYDNYRSGDSELHNELVIGLDWQSLLEKTLLKNKKAIKKPYFGRIDYTEQEDYSLYIGKNGIMKNPKEVLIVDWRAPVAAVYYDSDLGESSYYSPQGEEISITLKKKRTYEIENGHLEDYYDTDVIANDEFLTKYLAKNKEVVLGEIIATIQKEQNEIIRDTPWHSVIVQGVAGSGKTTVAMHRISYLLYNYKERLRQEEFYIIGSNKTLLNYITGVLPSLEVYFAKQITMLEFFLGLLEKNFSMKKYKLADILKEENKAFYKQFKGSLTFVRQIDEFLRQYEFNLIPTDNIEYHGGIIYSTEDIKKLIDTFPMYPTQEKMDMLNKRLQRKIEMVNEKEGEEKEKIRAEVKKYKQYFGKKNKKLDLIEIYKKFYFQLKSMEATSQIATVILEHIDMGQFDLYDLAMLTLIKKRICSTDDFSFLKFSLQTLKFPLYFDSSLPEYKTYLSSQKILLFVMPSNHSFQYHNRYSGKHLP